MKARLIGARALQMCELKQIGSFNLKSRYLPDINSKVSRYFIFDMKPRYDIYLDTSIFIAIFMFLVTFCFLSHFMFLVTFCVSCHILCFFLLSIYFLVAFERRRPCWKQSGHIERIPIDFSRSLGQMFWQCLHHHPNQPPL